MKSFLPLLLLTCSIISFGTKAQPLSTIESIDINNIAAAILVHGDMMYDPSNYNPRCEFPRGTGIHAGGPSALWMGGMDGSNFLHVSAQTYRQSGSDYWPGPLDNTGALSITESQKWARVWKVNFFDINNHIANGTHTTGNTPKDILEWPAKGNTYAKGSGNASLTITNDMAPFVDLNSNGVYEPLSGEYPDMKGDQMLWWVFSDNGPTHDNHSSSTASTPLKVEVHAMAYGYKRNTAIDNVIYFEYDIINKSGVDYNNYRAAIYADIDLGYTNDDYVGFDSARRLGYMYNGTTVDGTGSGTNEYGAMPPISGYAVLNMPGDNGSNYAPMGSFMSINNDGTVMGNPTHDLEYNYYMRSAFRDGQHLKNDFTGWQKNSTGRGTGPLANYMYTGNPSDTNTWAECICNNPVGDRRFVMSTSDHLFKAGTTVNFDFAFVVTNVGSNHACPNADITDVLTVADTAWKNYNTPPKTFVSVNDVQARTGFKLYPNPVSNTLNVSFPDGALPERLSVTDITGRNVTVSYANVGQELTIDVQHLSKGTYILNVERKGVKNGQVFVKE
ncbi:MAG: T9SS type A sorting domain-containing protein [Chitinophagales bacterium]|nr:T9SS type A sorting domain-containing protein [Chitinophagaceae bacterium]MCB9066050.1 T9SS type A sorting domain-containing protein [Chitinophagales bacterium]